MYDIDIISEGLNLYEQGYTQKEIAIKLGCGERTVVGLDKIVVLIGLTN